MSISGRPLHAHEASATVCLAFVRSCHVPVAVTWHVSLIDPNFTVQFTAIYRRPHLHSSSVSEPLCGELTRRRVPSQISFIYQYQTVQTEGVA